MMKEDPPQFIFESLTISMSNLYHFNRTFSHGLQEVINSPTLPICFLTKTIMDGAIVFDILATAKIMTVEK